MSLDFVNLKLLKKMGKTYQYLGTSRGILSYHSDVDRVIKNMKWGVFLLYSLIEFIDEENLPSPPIYYEKNNQMKWKWEKIEPEKYILLKSYSRIICVYWRLFGLIKTRFISEICRSIFGLALTPQLKKIYRVDFQ